MQQLERRVVLTETESGGHLHVTTMALVGPAGAVLLAYAGGNHRMSETALPGVGPVGVVSREEDMLSCELAPCGLEVHSFVQLHESDDRIVSPLFEGGVWCHQIEQLGFPRATAMLTRLVQPGGLEATWDELEVIWHEQLSPELNPSGRLAREHAARLAEATARGADLAGRMGAIPAPESAEAGSAAE